MEALSALRCFVKYSKQNLKRFVQP